MVARVKKFVEFWLKRSNFVAIVNELVRARLGRSEQRHKNSIFVEKSLFIVLVRLKCAQLHYTKMPLKQSFRQKFLRDEI